jgi:DNA mismatch repair protein MutL
MLLVPDTPDSQFTSNTDPFDNADEDANYPAAASGPDPDGEGVVLLLDENTANRIAAGEVIERPSSVVKELVENALDAGATRIEVELAEGGKRKITVRDNGCGMTQGDAVLALQRHATSKIRSADDLFDIRTLGFRGEALPSIASVSDFRIVTKRRQDDAATEVIVRAGEIIRVETAGAPDGTEITVENLFASIPARLKFLKTTQTELGHTVDLLHRLSLAYHEIAFRLVHDGYEMFAYPGARDGLHAVAAVWGRDVARAMVPVRYDAPALSVRGWVSNPSVSRTTRAAQVTFVNGRFVRSRTISHAFEAAFKQLMTTERHPVCALFVEIAPPLVDVNVHPPRPRCVSPATATCTGCPSRRAARPAVRRPGSRGQRPNLVCRRSIIVASGTGQPIDGPSPPFASFAERGDMPVAAPLPSPPVPPPPPGERGSHQDDGNGFGLVQATPSTLPAVPPTSPAQAGERGDGWATPSSASMASGSGGCAYSDSRATPYIVCEPTMRCCSLISTSPTSACCTSR